MFTIIKIKGIEILRHHCPKVLKALNHIHSVPVKCNDIRRCNETHKSKIQILVTENVQTYQ